MNSIAAKLTKDHAEIHDLLQRLAQDANAPLPGALDATWSVFERRLIRHMEAEERFLLPLLEASHPKEVARVQDEHARIRDLIAELGVAVELHTIRVEHVSDLIALLKAHAEHEDRALYQLAGEKASTAIEHGIARQLQSAIEGLASLRVEPGQRRARP